MASQLLNEILIKSRSTDNFILLNLVMLFFLSVKAGCIAWVYPFTNLG
jgi:hypothetical protein